MYVSTKSLRVCVLLHQYDEEGDDIMAAQSDQ
jgi:hypothetical protein